MEGINILLCGLHSETMRIQKTRLQKVMETIAFSPRESCLSGLSVHLFIYLLHSYKTVYYIQVHVDGVGGSGGRAVLE